MSPSKLSFFWSRLGTSVLGCCKDKKENASPHCFLGWVGGAGRLKTDAPIGVRRMLEVSLVVFPRTIAKDPTKSIFPQIAESYRGSNF